MRRPGTEKLNEARGKMQEAIQNLSETMGPRHCPHGDYSECDECTWDDTFAMPGGALLSEFVLLMTWTGMDDGESYIGIQTAPGQLMSHTNGLLFTALYE
jgi:hypothetical protein